MSDIPSWQIVGERFDSCSCAVPCPCTFAQAPDNGFVNRCCSGASARAIMATSNSTISALCGSAARRATSGRDRRRGSPASILMIMPTTGQMEALPAIIGSRAGGFPGWVNECFAGGRQSRGIERAKINYEIAPDLGHWGVEILSKIKAWAKAISGPTSPPGKYPQLINAPCSETGPGPQLVTWGKSTILSVDAHGFKFEYTLNSAKHIPFDWSGP